jgi:asparagine synthase (glutamine-hydrolysing)
MCGIAGVVHLNGKGVERKDLEHMVELIQHRGPDGFGFFVEDNIGLGHARLSILDLSEAGAQPMYFEDKYVIVYNGEVYNYLEIGEELKSFGYTFKSGSDTEVILAAYDKWGEDCVHKFNGMWSFVIYDKIQVKLFCSRDRFGVKPFYFYKTTDSIYFGSEIKQLLDFVPEKKVNKNILLDYIVLSLLEQSDETFFEGIKKLLPSHNLVIDLKTNTYSISRYYSIKIDKSLINLSEHEAVELYQKEFDRAVKYRLRSDVKVATCLSGGLDSSAVASFASKLYQSNSGIKFSAITAKSTDKKKDETGYASKVAERCDLDWHVIEPTTSDFLEVIDEVIKTQEEPFGGPSIVMQYYVFKKAKEIKAPVMLDGQGGDETLLGYERYFPAYLLSLPLKERIKGFINSSKNSKLSKKELLLYYLYFTIPSIRIRRQLKRSGFVKNKYLKLINKEIIIEMSKTYNDVDKLQLLEITNNQLPSLLKYEDRNSMRHSIESRLPFLDYKLVELSLSLNNKFKIKDGWTKYLLRKVVEEKLPSDVVWRKNKIGFEAPANEWMKNKNFFLEKINQSKILQEIFSEPFQNTNDISMFWKLYNIARWEEVFNVKMDPIK